MLLKSFYGNLFYEACQVSPNDMYEKKFVFNR